MKEDKKALTAVTVYYASVEFEGKWYTSVPSENIDDALDFIKRARLKTHARNMRANVLEDVKYKAAE